MTKIKDGFVLREVAGKAVVIAVGEASRHFHGMIHLNKTAKCIWEGLKNGLDPDAIAQTLVDAFDVDLEQAKTDTQRLLQKMREAGVIED